MKKNNMKSELKDNKGITLIMLIITIIVMLIIAGIVVDIGIESLQKTKLKAMYSELEIIQRRVDEIVTTNESYIDNDGNKIVLEEQGTSCTASQQTKLEDIKEKEGVGLNLTISNFRYFTKGQLESILGLSDMKYNVFIDFSRRIIIAEEGITVNGDEHHILKKNIYYPEYNETYKGEALSLEYRIEKYGTSNYKIVLLDSDGNEIKDGTLKYKKSTSKYWETANGLNIIISELTQYDIEYKNVYNIRTEDQINVQINQQTGEPEVI